MIFKVISVVGEVIITKKLCFIVLCNYLLYSLLNIIWLGGAWLKHVHRRVQVAIATASRHK